MIVYLLLVLSIIFIIILHIRNKFLLLGLEKCEKTIMEDGMRNHEYQNQLIVISGYMDCRNYSKASNYLKRIITDYKNRNINEIGELSNFPNGGIKNLLQYKLIKMDYYNIKYSLFIDNNSAKKVELVPEDKYSKITKILGVILDNAIDESKKCIDKYVEIAISTEYNKLKISISNNLSNRIKPNLLQKNNYTTKGKGHGFGLRIVEEIINKDNNIELDTIIRKEMFIQNLYFKFTQN